MSLTSSTQLESPRWHVSGTVSVRGTAFHGAQALAGVDLAARFRDVDSLDALCAALSPLAGFYAVIVDADDATYAAVDHARSMPLAYTDDGRVGEPRALVGDVDPAAYDPRAADEMLTGGRVSGARTLVPGLRSLRAGEAVRVTGTDVDRRRYHRHVPRAEESVDPALTATLVDRLDAALSRAGERFVDFVDGRTVALSLSGGYDSRLIALLLAEQRYEDVVAFAYGSRDDEDVRLSERVADALGFRWEFVPYTEDRWRRWYESEGRRYYREAFGYDAIVNDGIALAVRDLLSSGRVPSDAVFTAGQCVTSTAQQLSGDIWATTEADGGIGLDLVGDPVEYPVGAFGLWRWDDVAFDSHLEERFRDAAPDLPLDTFAGSLAAIESWKWEEIETKYFVGDARQYEFYDADWWFPLFDREVLDAWADLPAAERIDRRAYLRLVDERYRRQTGDRSPPSTASKEAVGFARIGKRVSESRVGAHLRGPFYRLYRHVADPDLPLGRGGIVPDEPLARLYTGREKIQAFQALAAAGRLSLDTGEVSDPPRAGAVSLASTPSP